MTISTSIYKSNKKSQVKLSIITVVKDDDIGLTDTMLSLTKLDLSNIEIVVWINSNSKRLQQHLNTANKYADIVLCGTDEGIFDAMNKAISFAEGFLILFLNARDRIVQPFKIKNLELPAIIRVQYKNYFGKKRFVNVSKTVKMGIPYCHQGMILPREGYLFDTKYKYGADYLALLNLKIDWPPPMLSEGLIEYDTTGVSTVNRWRSDKYTLRIIWSNFGAYWALIHFTRCVMKLGIKRAYDLYLKMLVV